MPGHHSHFLKNPNPPPDPSSLAGSVAQTGEATQEATAPSSTTTPSAVQEEAPHTDEAPTNLESQAKQRQKPVLASESTDSANNNTTTITNDGASTTSLGKPDSTSSTTQLAHLKTQLKASLRQFPDFPTKGILFEDILPLFSDAQRHSDLLTALELHVIDSLGGDEHNKPDVIVGLEARGFLFGPSLALRMGAAFVPVRKVGKLPGPLLRASFAKEYGEDWFEMQADALRPGQKVVIVDDIIATGGSAAAAGSLVKQLGAELQAYIFILELDFLKGREKLDAPAYTLLSSQETKHNSDS
ncbi:adenine phosphoribosyltransferase [Agyrium rufum]|nr:adenine phosphoribosyltransferase [Agyrium rufum]